MATKTKKQVPDEMFNEEVPVTESEDTNEASETSAIEGAGKKEASRAEQYKALVQSVISETLGVKVSKQKAWEMYKTLIYKTVTDVVENGRIPISGVNTWEVQQCGARKSKAESHNFVPKFRFRTSSKIDEFLEQAVPGVMKK